MRIQNARLVARKSQTDSPPPVPLAALYRSDFLQRPASFLPGGPEAPRECEPLTGRFWKPIRHAGRRARQDLSAWRKSRSSAHVTRGAARGRDIAFHRVVHYHAVGIEAPAERSNGSLHALDPAARQPVAVAMIVERDNFLLKYPVQILSVARVVHAHVRVSSAGSD